MSFTQKEKYANHVRFGTFPSVWNNVTNSVYNPYFLLSLLFVSRLLETKTYSTRKSENALLWETKARETDDVKRLCKYYGDISYL